MADEAKDWWEKHAREFQAAVRLPVDVIYGNHANERDLQIIGPVTGKRLLEIGCGGAQCGIAFAKQGAHVTGIDIAGAQLEFARELAHEHGVEITFHQRDMTDLGVIGSETQDIVFSASALHYVDDIVACFREVHRVLRRGGVFVWSVGHPCMWIVDGDRPTYSYFDTGKVISGADVSDEVGFAFAENHRTVSEYVNALVDAGLTIQRMVEPDIRPVDHADPANHRWGSSPRALELFPSALIVKSSKP
jgi:SAM-dependent methyltransferase